MKLVVRNTHLSGRTTFARGDGTFLELIERPVRAVVRRIIRPSKAMAATSQQPSLHALGQVALERALGATFSTMINLPCMTLMILIDAITGEKDWHA